MTYSEQIALAARLLHLTEDEAREYSHQLESVDALYVSVPIKGGSSLLIGADGTVLYANSSVPYDVHIDEFNKGRRTPLEAFE